MKNILTLALIGSSIAGVAQEGRTHKHCFSPKVFYREHKEEGYFYSAYGAGIEYSLHRPEGINVKLSANTNGKTDKVFVETENSIFFRAPIHTNHSLFPVLSSRFSSHHVSTLDQKMYYINKSTVYAGIGWEIIPDDSFRFRVEGQAFRDMHNAVMVQEGGTFWGQSYSNPWGYRAKVGFLSNWKDKIFVDIEGYFAKTIQKCYQEMGLEIAFKWGF